MIRAQSFYGQHENTSSIGASSFPRGKPNLWGLKRDHQSAENNFNVNVGIFAIFEVVKWILKSKKPLGGVRDKDRWIKCKVTVMGMNNSEKMANGWGRDGKKDLNATKYLNGLYKDFFRQIR